MDKFHRNLIGGVEEDNPEYVDEYDPRLDWTPPSSTDPNSEQARTAADHSGYRESQQPNYSLRGYGHPYPLARTSPFATHRVQAEASPIYHNPSAPHPAFQAVNRNFFGPPYGSSHLSSAHPISYSSNLPPQPTPLHHSLPLANENYSQPVRLGVNPSFQPSHIPPGISRDSHSRSSFPPRLSTSSTPPKNLRNLATPDEGEQSEGDGATATALEKYLNELDRSIETWSEKLEAVRQEVKGGTNRTKEEEELVKEIRKKKQQYEDLVWNNEAPLKPFFRKRARFHAKKPRSTAGARSSPRDYTHLPQLAETADTSEAVKFRRRIESMCEMRKTLKVDGSKYNTFNGRISRARKQLTTWESRNGPLS